MQEIKAPDREPPKFKGVFLAGGITNCPDWQSEVVKRLDAQELTVFNPRREAFPGDLRGEEEQVSWEFERLRSADLVSFWFDKGSLDPITLFELGSALERPGAVIVGIDPDYARKVDLDIQIRLRRPEVLIVSSLDDVTGGIISFFKKEA